MIKSYFNPDFKLPEGLTPQVVRKCYEELLASLKTCTDEAKALMDNVTRPSDEEMKVARRAMAKERNSKNRIYNKALNRRIELLDRRHRQQEKRHKQQEKRHKEQEKREKRLRGGRVR